MRADRSLHSLRIYIIENKISLFLGCALCWRGKPRFCRRVADDRAIRFNRVAILRYTQGAWILTRGELVCYIVEIGAGGARNVLSAGRNEDSLLVVLRAGRWLHDGVIGCGDLTDRRHRLRLDRLRPPKPGIAERELARLALVGVTRNPIDLYKRPPGTRKIGPASSRWGSPPVA